MRLLIHHCVLNSYLFAFSAPVIAFYSTVHNWICRLTIMYIYSDYFASSFSYFLQCAWKFLHIPQELRIRSRGTERHSASN